MKETLMKWNVAFYAILYNVSLVYAGYYYGRFNNFIYIYLFFIVFYLVMMCIAISQMKNTVIGTIKSYCIMAVVTLLLISVWWGLKLQSYFREGMFPWSEVDFFIYPGILFIGSALIAVNYFKCAAITRKEDRNLHEAICNEEKAI